MGGALVTRPAVVTLDTRRSRVRHTLSRIAVASSVRNEDRTRITPSRRNAPWSADVSVVAVVILFSSKSTGRRAPRS